MLWTVLAVCYNKEVISNFIFRLKKKFRKCKVFLDPLLSPLQISSLSWLIAVPGLTSYIVLSQSKGCARLFLSKTPCDQT